MDRSLHKNGQPVSFYKKKNQEFLLWSVVQDEGKHSALNQCNNGLNVSCASPRELLFLFTVLVSLLSLSATLPVFPVTLPSTLVEQCRPLYSLWSRHNLLFVLTSPFLIFKCMYFLAELHHPSCYFCPLFCSVSQYWPSYYIWNRLTSFLEYSPRAWMFCSCVALLLLLLK